MLRLPADLDWTALAVGLALALLVLLIAWRLFGRGKRGAQRRHHRPDVLDEGVGPAQRNQALIDAPSATAAALAATGPDILAGMGEVVAVAAAEEAVAAADPAGTGSGGDDLARIKGIGPKLVALLGQLGVTSYAQIAAWSDADLDRIDGQLGAFAGRPRRDNWVEQAKLLAAGDAAGFESRFGKL